jgi:simple sugar transport system permease protein
MLGGRTGLFSVSQEGIMLVGASLGFLGAYLYGSLLYGMLLAMFVGGLFGLTLAYFTTTFIPTLPDVAIPGLSQIPILGDIFFNQNVLAYFAILLSIFLYYLLYKTSFGLELRSVGESPKAADSLGVNVSLMRYVTATVGGMLMGLAGAYLPMVYTGTFTQGMVQGRGWIAIALTFFGGWRPDLIFFGALFFAGVEVLALRVQVGSLGVPYQFLLTLPYIATILVMIFASRRVRAPAFLGQNYDREKRTLS